MAWPFIRSNIYSVLRCKIYFSFIKCLKKFSETRGRNRWTEREKDREREREREKERERERELWQKKYPPLSLSEKEHIVLIFIDTIYDNVLQTVL